MVHTCKNCGYKINMHQRCNQLCVCGFRVDMKAVVIGKIDDMDAINYKRHTGGMYYYDYTVIGMNGININLKTKEGMVSIEVSGKSDEEIKQAILAKLAAEGWEDADVQVSTDEDGQKWIRIHMGKPDEERETMLQFNLGESDKDMVLNLGTAAAEFEIDIKDKIDEEIRQEIVEKLEKRGFIAPEVKIITDPDGEKEIIIKINKDEQK